MKRCQDFRYRRRGELALQNAGSNACRGKTPCPDRQHHRRAIQQRRICSLMLRKPGALSYTTTEQARAESTRAACRIVHIRRRVRASNVAIPGKPGVTPPTTVPGAAFSDSRRERRTCGIGRRQRERFGSHHSSKVNSVCAPILGLAAPFFRAATTVHTAKITQALPRLGRSVYPEVLPRPRPPRPFHRAGRQWSAATSGSIPHRPAQAASSARINNRSRSLIPGA